MLWQQLGGKKEKGGVRQLSEDTLPHKFILIFFVADSNRERIKNTTKISEKTSEKVTKQTGQQIIPLSCP